MLKSEPERVLLCRRTLAR